MAERSSYALHNRGMVIPKTYFAQDISDEIHSMQEVLDQLYTEMLPLCSSLISVGRGLAGFAAYGTSHHVFGDNLLMRSR